MTDKDQTQTAGFPFNVANGASGMAGPLSSDVFTVAEDQPADFATGLVSLAFIKAAIRRSALVSCIAAVVGLLIGLGIYVRTPHAYQASTSLLLTYGPYEDVNTEAADAQAMAQSRTVAELAVRRLGLRQSADSFLAAYTVTTVTNRVLLITVSAPTSNLAVLWANGVARAVLQFRADELQAQPNLAVDVLNHQITQTRKTISSISAQISQLSSLPASPTQHSQLSHLQTERSHAITTLSDLQQSLLGDQTNAYPATMAAVKGSTVLDAAVLLPHPRLKPLLLYAALGFLVGLVLSMAIAVIRALASDRLRRRDDIAQALGAPVKLSVGTVRLNRWLPGRGGRSHADDADVQRIATFLSRAVQTSFRGVCTLAVIPIDDLKVAASSLVSLAVFCAKQGKQVVVADLCSGVPAARLLGRPDPGVHVVDAGNARLVVAVPGPDDLIPVGPLYQEPAEAQRSPFTEEVAAVCASGDILLTLATLDPSLGSEHLATWATDAVAVVTAGRSSWTRINAVGELVRLSGTHLVSGVLVGADETDESLGLGTTTHATKRSS